MFIGKRRQDATARRAHDEALLQEVWLDHVFDRIALLGERRGDGVDAGGTARVELGETSKVTAIHGVEPAVIHIEAAKRAIGGSGVDGGGWWLGDEPRSGCAC